jgi:hypothetical protein
LEPSKDEANVNSETAFGLSLLSSIGLNN